MYSEETLQIIAKVRLLSSNKGYFLRFYELVAETKRYVQAWELLEEERDAVGLPRRYSEYQNFLVGRRRWHEMERARNRKKENPATTGPY